MASGQIFFALILTVAKVTTLELIAKQKSPTILQLKPFSPHFFHDCILTPKRRSIFKQPRYIPGTTHINFSHAFRISALSYLLKKEVLFCNFGQYTVAHFYRLPTTQSPNLVSSQIKNFLENTNSRYSRKLRPANVQKRKQKCSEKKSLLTDNLVTRVSNVCADVLILGNLVSALSLY